MPYSFASLEDGYTQDLAKMAVRPSWKPVFARQAARVAKGRERYENFLTANNLRIPWQVIGIVHLMEGDCNFGTYLGNGQLLSRPTTMVPRGRGPFKSWEDGALDAIRIQGMDRIADWSTEYVCWVLEAYNGFGYHSHGVLSPYLWSGTNLYSSGKFMEAPGRGSWYSPSTVSGQAGAIPIYLELLSEGQKPMAEVTPMPPDPRSGGSMVQSPPVPHDSAGVNVSTSRAASAMGTVTVGGLITVLAPLLHYFNPTEVHFMLAILGGASGIAIVAANAWAYLNFNSKSSRNTVAQIEYWSMLAQDLAKQLADGGKTLNPTAPLNVPPQAPPGGN